MPEFRDEQGNLIATDDFTDASGRVFCDGKVMPDDKQYPRDLVHQLSDGKWESCVDPTHHHTLGQVVSLDATVIPADGKKRVVIVADDEGDWPMPQFTLPVGVDGKVPWVSIIVGYLDALSEGGSE